MMQKEGNRLNKILVVVLYIFCNATGQSQNLSYKYSYLDSINIDTYKVDIIVDSTIDEVLSSYLTITFYQLDTNKLYTDRSIVVYKDGYIFDGYYSEGKRVGYWMLYKQEKNKSKLIGKYKYLDGILMGVISDKKTVKKKNSRKLNYIPSVDW